jgi:Ca2+-binding EF-hand superfamily protein
MLEIELFRKTESLRLDLENRHDFSTYACFRAIDDMNEGDINPENLRQFFKNNGYYPTEDEVIAIVRRLDVDADCKISYAEFSEAIKAQESSREKFKQNR